jgi:hypothetical protein
MDYRDINMNWFKKASTYIGYHGTNQDFDQFQIGQKYQDQKGGTSKEGFWFTDSIEEAQEYAQYSAERTVTNQIEHEKKIQEYLRRIENAERRGDWGLQEQLILEMEDMEYGAINAPPSGQKVIEAVLTLNNPYIVDASEDGFDPQTTINTARRTGYDGVIFYNMFDSPKMFSKIESKLTTQYLVFDNRNIQIRNII